LPKARRKNIKIAHKKIFSFEFFAPFNFLFFEQKEKTLCQLNQRLMKNRPEKSISGLSDDPVFCFTISFFRSLRFNEQWHRA